MKQGYYSLVLHAHLPYVRHEEDHRLEQNWLFEAMTESYIPLIDAIDRANVSQAITISLSPPLMEMLADPLLKKRYSHYLKNVERLLKKELRFQKQHEVPDHILTFYKNRYSFIREFLKKWRGNLLEAFRDLNSRGLITCITSSATHTFLPYLLTEEGVRLQIQEGIKCFEKHFQFRPRGFWVPECAFNETVDKVLAEEGIRYTFVDEHAILTADPIPQKGSGAPVYSKHGVALFPRNTSLSAQVWSSTDGYPGDEWYREFYRDIAYDRDWSYIKPHMHPEEIRIDSGLKFNRITGAVENKELYHPQVADQRAQEHARHFIQAIKEQIEQFGEQCFPPYLMMTPFDAELFGHWWFEGPKWLEYVLNDSTNNVLCITPESFLENHQLDLESVSVTFTTWGREGYGSVWLNERNSWVYPVFQRMEDTLRTLSSRYKDDATDFEKRVLIQLMRDWMLATSSDWAFIIDGDTTSQYAVSRLREHEQRFDQLLTDFIAGTLTPTELNKMEQFYPFLMDLKGEAFIKSNDPNNTLPVRQQEHHPVILMLSWEYPPVIAGGLSIHVSHLAHELAKKSYEVHVLTSYVDGLPSHQEENGVHVHRVQGLNPHAASFNDWIGGLNFAMVKAGEELAKTQKIDLIHAHDWLVSVAAIGLKQKLQLPLLATIHATESGRINGSLNSRQEMIRLKEERLMHEAKQIIVCSQSMKRELTHDYRMSKNKISIIPNASRVSQSTNSDSLSQTQINSIYCFGRLVPEKGFQILLQALHLLKDRNKSVHVTIAGEGPYKESLERMAKELDVSNRVSFVGFLEPEECLRQLEKADIVVIPSLYEPFGLAALEAMSSAKAVIASKVGGLVELVTHNQTGLLVEPGDARDLATQLERLVDNLDEVKKLGQEAATHVFETYSWEKTAQLTIEQMNRMIKERTVSIN